MLKKCYNLGQECLILAYFPLMPGSLKKLPPPPKQTIVSLRNRTAERRGRQNVCDKPDRAIFCVFCRDLHLQ